ncbi:hypothetical protein [Flavobacterium hiemivividum]|uniref:Uncharacterized protein n=1 Tax=Flavobacterium hiemivividum TaxID=2541734 RepID=A0A4R5CXP1_9FLAO|nr:hypothetical protein [Flavobacterium hiemivividum]TDE05346.1 hypothetical protein E0F98_04325 [Flavobacterium hiemivividum]
MLVLLIIKPFEFKAKLVGRFLPGKPTTVQFGNLLYAIPELNTEHFPINNNYPASYTQENERILY